MVDDLDLALAQRFSSSATVLPTSGESAGHGRLGRVALDVEGGVERGGTLAAARAAACSRRRGTATPATAMPAPTGVKSNMRNGSPTSSSRMRETMMFGEVPISVIVPPSSEPKAIGISRQEGEVPVRRASWKATGISMASAPMFLTKAESTVTARDEHDDLHARCA